MFLRNYPNGRKKMTPQEAAEYVKSFGRMGDTELIHVNKAELGILANAVPLTINPETGQPEAFLPFILSLLGGALAPSIGMSTALASGIGSFAGGMLMGQDPLTAAGSAALNAFLPGGDAASAAMDGTKATLEAGKGAVMNEGLTAAAGGMPIYGGQDQITGFGDRLLAGAEGALKNPIGLMMQAATMDIGQDKGPKAKKAKYIPEQFPGMQRSAAYNPAPIGYSSGTQGEWTNFLPGYRGFAGGGAVDGGGGGFFLDRLTGRNSALNSGIASGPYGGLFNGRGLSLFGYRGGDMGGKPMYDGPVYQRTAPQVADRWSSLAGSSGLGAGPATPVAAPTGLSMNFAPADFSSRLAAARPQGFSMGGEVDGGDGGEGLLNNLLTNGVFGFVPLLWQQAQDGKGPLAGLFGLGKEKERPAQAMNAPMGGQPMRGYADGGMVGDDEDLALAYASLRYALPQDTPQPRHPARADAASGPKRIADYTSEELQALGRDYRLANPLYDLWFRSPDRNVDAQREVRARGRRAQENDRILKRAGFADGGMVPQIAQAIAPSGGGITPISQGNQGGQDANLVKLTVAAIMGQLQPEQAQQVVMAFVQRFGEEALQDLASRVNQKNSGRQVRGPGDGLSDSVPAQIDGDGNQPAALSTGEYVIPAQAVADLGNGSSDAGSRQLDAMVQRARMARGGPVNPPRIDPRKVMPV